MNTVECLDVARVALLQAENIEQRNEIRERAGQTNHAREFCSSPRLRHIRTALLALSQIETTNELNREGVAP